MSTETTQIMQGCLLGRIASGKNTKSQSLKIATQSSAECIQGLFTCKNPLLSPVYKIHDNYAAFHKSENRKKEWPKERAKETLKHLRITKPEYGK